MQQEELSSAVVEDEVELPEEPDVDDAVQVDGDNDGVQDDASDAQPSAAERAFDLIDAGKLGEAGLLAAVGVSRDGYVPNDAITHRALNAVEQGRLSEANLVKLLG